MPNRDIKTRFIFRPPFLRFLRGCRANVRVKWPILMEMSRVGRLEKRNKKQQKKVAKPIFFLQTPFPRKMAGVIPGIR
jgi:hypothetical protein